MREKKVHQLMTDSPAFQKRGEDGQSLVLKQSQIRAYFSRRAATLKRKNVDASIRGEDDDSDGDGDGNSDKDDGGYLAYTVLELKSLLRARNLAISGLKGELAARLLDDDKERGPRSDSEDGSTPKRRRRTAK
jgi:hypothetical protein